MLFFGSVFALLVAAVVAIPAPEIVTNGERLARRLPPLPPKFGRTLPGVARSVDDPTPAYVASRGKPSAVPVRYEGRIEVLHPRQRTRIRYLESTTDGKFGAAFNPNLGVSFTTLGSNPFNIRATNRKFKGPPFLGGASKKPKPSLSRGSADAVDFTNVKKTSPWAIPAHMDGEFGESAIWLFDPATKEITAHWINPDKTLAPTVIALDEKTNTIFFVGSIDKYNAQAADPATLVKFFLA